MAQHIIISPLLQAFRSGLLFLFCLVLVACQSDSAGAGSKGHEQDDSMVKTGRPETSIRHFEDGKVAPPEWTRDLTIYEVNIRQYSEAGDFDALRADLPRLKELGVGILWLMPIHPIGEENRKGGRGSYYSVQDYKGINPAFGNEESFGQLVDEIHQAGMYVILDWVANHTAWDHPWTKSHPEFYTKDSLTGGFTPPVADWSDVIDLDYDNPEMREAMIDALEYWVRDFDVDGYRCDVAGMVPVGFWDDVRERLDAIKPVFMLAEWEDPALHENAFDMTYGWDMHHQLNSVASAKEEVAMIDSALQRNKRFQARDYRMNFTSNHDENTWNGTVFERMGDNAVAMAAMTFALEGMPLIYSGQEAPMRKRLAFFEKDQIDWGTYEMQEFYRQLVQFKKDHPALWNGEFGQPMEVHPAADGCYLFSRGTGKEAVLAAFNFGSQMAELAVPAAMQGKNGISPAGEGVSLKESITLRPHGYLVVALSEDH